MHNINEITSISRFPIITSIGKFPEAFNKGDVPSPPPPPKPPAQTQASDNVAAMFRASRKPKGMMSTILTSGMGAPNTATAPQKTLLGQ